MNARALAGLAVAAFLPSLFGAFQFDDFNVIVHEPAVHSWAAYLERATGVRPLLKASYTLNWTLGGGAPGFHLFNIAVHALNTVLVYHVGRELCARFLADPLTRQSRALFSSAGVAALLFALHPVQVEAVTYISGRSSSLMAAFYLGALLAYLRGAHWSVSGVLFALAVATKETALTLPFALLLVETSTAGARGVAYRKLLPHGVIFLACAAFIVLNPRTFELATFGFTRRDAMENLLTQAGGVAYLVARLLGLQGPNIDPALPVRMQSDLSLIVQGGGLLLLFLVAILQLRRRPWVGFGVLWFFLHLAPTNSFIPRLDVANDRQLYLAGWGLFFALAVQLQRARVPRMALGALLVACAAGSLGRQLDYTSEVALWEADARAAPWNARAYNNLGYAYERAGRRDEARRAYATAIAFDPNHVKARMNLRKQGLSPFP